MSPADTGEAPEQLPIEYPIPDPPEQDPSSWDDSRLRLYGLPPRPDRTTQQRRYEAWMETFGHQLRFIPGTEMSIELLTTAQDVPEPMLTTASSRFLDSPNWSGAFLSATRCRTFTQVFGRWTVPPLRIPPDGQEPLYQCASWIGLDGQRHYRNSTLPQVGTVQTLAITGGTSTLTLGAWTQWWVPNDPNAGPRAIRDFPLNVGDDIRAVLTVLDEHAALCNLVNWSTDPPTFVARRIRAPSLLTDHASANAARQRYSITGATVAWVQERSADPKSPGRLYPLADFGETRFSSCLAVEEMAEHADPLTQTLGSALFIRMYEIRHAPERTVYVSMPERAGETGFVVRYGDVWPRQARA